MKSILYLGATLMIGAGIYGFVDYKRTSQRKEFINMYQAKETPEPAVTNIKQNEVAVKKEIIVPEKSATDTTPNMVTKVIGAEKKYKPAGKRVFNYKLFSRAPLEERYIDKKISRQPVPGKSESPEDGKSERPLQ